MIEAFLVDDEPLALKRLSRMLGETGRVKVVGTSSDPVAAVDYLTLHSCDVLFLDIEMPLLNGFELVAQLDPQPIVVFTTAYHQYALKAFDVNSIDYLLKPIEPQHLERALNKIERIRGGAEARPEAGMLLQRIAEMVQAKTTDYPSRIASRAGDRTEFIDLARITHFFSSDKLTYAATASGKAHAVDYTIADLEQKLDPKKFARVHRSALVNLDYVCELHPWFGGRMQVRLKDGKQTDLTVSRDRVKALKERLLGPQV